MVWSLPLFMLLLGLYPGTALSPALEIKRTSRGLTMLFAGYLVLSISLIGFDLAQLAFLVSGWLVAIWALPAARIFGRSMLGRCNWWGLRTVVVGFEAGADSVLETLKRHRSWGLRPVAFLDATSTHGPDLEHHGLEIAALARRTRAFWAVAVLRPGEETFARDILGVPNVIVVSKTLAATPLGVPFLGAGLSGVQARNLLLHPAHHIQKRALDIGITTLVGLALAPLVAVIAIAIKLTSRGPVFFKHERLGQRGRRMWVYKFRTMVPDANQRLESCLAEDPELRREWQETQKLKKDPRVTTVGSLLRRWSLDELPQLWNILRGDMSLVGPRPIVDDEVQKYGPAFELYKRVPPGLTGLWQVYGRNNTSYPRRVDLDSYYVRNWSIWLEMHIILRTLRVVICRDGAF